MITFDGIIFTSANRHGGISVYFKELLRHAAQANKPMQVLVHDANVTAEEIGCQPQQRIVRQPRLLERYRQLRGLPKGLLHSSYYRTSPQGGVRNVVTVYDFTYEKFTHGAQRVVHTLQKRAAILRAEAALCISENTRQDLLRLLPEYPAERTFVTHLAANEKFKPLEHATVSLTRQPFVLFVSGRTTYKNFSLAVEAVRRIPGLAIVCVGGGLFSVAERALLERMLPGRHYHAGRVDTAGLNELYNAAVCLVYPSMYEGFGIPPLEAMSAGCPFVALNTSSIPEVAGEAGILLEESDPQALASAIEACGQTARRVELRERGFAQARQFSWSKMAAQTFAVYRTLQGLPAA